LVPQKIWLNGRIYVPSLSRRRVTAASRREVRLKLTVPRNHDIGRIGTGSKGIATGLKPT
jgi:hypothetical protein